MESHCTIWLQWFFKVLMYQLNIFVRKQTSVVWPEELCREYLRGVLHTP